jgi:hypothetical protein
MPKSDKKRAKEQAKASRPASDANGGDTGHHAAKASRPASDANGGGTGHHAAKAHGRPATVDASLPSTRDELLAAHAAARRRRAEATLGGPEYRAAVEEIARIEIRVADIERSMTPPRG